MFHTMTDFNELPRGSDLQDGAHSDELPQEVAEVSGVVRGAVAKVVKLEMPTEVDFGPSEPIIPTSESRHSHRDDINIAAYVGQPPRADHKNEGSTIGSDEGNMSLAARLANRNGAADTTADAGENL